MTNPALDILVGGANGFEKQSNDTLRELGNIEAGFDAMAQQFEAIGIELLLDVYGLVTAQLIHCHH